jgi:hypothetical protein
VSDEEDIDTGFDDVLAGNVYVAPVITGSVQPPEPHVCANATGGDELTATVSEPEGTPTQISDATKALVNLPPIDMVTLAKLARAIAMDIKETHAILSEFGLTQVQYDYLSTQNTVYKNALEAACIEWHSPLSTKERVAVAAAAILEDSLPTLGARMQNRGEGLPGVTETAKLFAKLAGVGERENSGAPLGERFVINIDLGGGQKVALAAGDAPTAPAKAPDRLQSPQAARATASSLEIQPLTETVRDVTPVRRDPEVS